MHAPPPPPPPQLNCRNVTKLFTYTINKLHVNIEDACPPPPPTHTHTQLQALQEMLVCQSSGKEHSDASFTGPLSHLSTNPSLALDQVKALIIATKAFRGGSTEANEPRYLFLHLHSATPTVFWYPLIIHKTHYYYSYTYNIDAELPEVSTERILKLTAEEKSNLFILVFIVSWRFKWVEY